MNWAEQVNRDGYRIIPAVVDKAVVGDLLERLTESELPRSRAGVRHMMRNRWVAEIAAGLVELVGCVASRHGTSVAGAAQELRTDGGVEAKADFSRRSECHVQDAMKFEADPEDMVRQ